jgi:hypothetical protein
MNEARNQFTFYKSYFDAIQGLKKKDQSDLILALCAYAIYETLPESLSTAASVAFKLIKPTIDAGRKKAKNGSIGGQANGKQNGSKTEANPKQGESSSEKEKEKEVEKEEEVESESYAHARKQHGEYKNVLLTDDEYATLKAELPDLEARIKYLSGYLAKTGKQYNSHFAVLRIWAEEDRKKTAKEGYRSSSFDLDEMFNANIARALRGV